MTRTLDSERRDAASGKAKSLVIFLHGYGANAQDLLGLAEPLAPHLPDTVFVAPNAPEKCAGSPGGFQWFPIPWIDGSSEQDYVTGMERAVEDLNAYLDQVMIDEGIGPEKTILFGFSQGTMMALHVAPRRDVAFAGVVGFSGRLISAELLENQAISKPPVLLVHGDQDDVVPPQSLQEAGDALTRAGFQVYAHVMKGTGHGIAPDGLSVAAAFMREMLGTV